MAADFPLLFRVILAFVALDLLILLVLLLSKYHYRQRYRHKAALSQLLYQGLLHQKSSSHIVSKLRKRPRLMFELLKELEDSVRLPSAQKSKLLQITQWHKLDEKLLDKLSARSRQTRIQAVMSLSVIGGSKVGKALQARLRQEPHWYIILAIIHSLSRMEYSPALPDIFGVLKKAPKWVRQKAFAILPAFGEPLHAQLIKMLANKEQRDIELILEISEEYPMKELHDYLLAAVHGSQLTLARRAAQVLAKVHPQQLYKDEVYRHSDPVVRRSGIRSLRYVKAGSVIPILLEALKDEPEVSKTAVHSLQALISQQQTDFERVIDEFDNARGSPQTEKKLAQVLESRIEYLFYRMSGERYHTVKRLVEVLTGMQQVAVIFGFLERNHDIQINHLLLEILHSVSEQDAKVQELCRRYLPDTQLELMGYSPARSAPEKIKAPLKKFDRLVLAGGLAALILVGPLLYTALHWNIFLTLSPMEHLLQFVRGYNYAFAFYAGTINTIYLLLLIFALVHLSQQLRNWATSSHRILFAKELLPSISVLAPAFNEERNIVNNVKSLLNLHYPEVELIVINDGSKDTTIETLIANFSLERSEVEPRAHLSTEPVRGIYSSRDFPNLTVIDKVNGGKADSLNAGINLAGNDYICTIDSDSLLEHDALLKIAYQTVLTDREPIALGGNILPANGCQVRNGRLTKINLPKNHLARFQTIEYMRAFLAGRLGWSLLNSMLIISGAFGLFIRKRVVEVGGYLTPRSEMHTSTMGEDMELVVRLHEHLREKRIPYKVFDAFNANCWTEVPESFKVLHRQRDRWHRGLMESIILHKKMLLNPRYGPVGTVAFPYFILFELIGPLLEMYGYINLLLGVILGVVSTQVAMLLFITVILYGILISVGSLLISENEILYFNNRETLLIILYAIVENFGFRQVISAIRVTAYVAYLFKEKPWGTMERKGFQNTVPPNKP